MANASPESQSFHGDEKKGHVHTVLTLHARAWCNVHWAGVGQIGPVHQGDGPVTMKKLATLPDFMPGTGWETGMHQGSTGDGGGDE